MRVRENPVSSLHSAVLPGEFADRLLRYNPSDTVAIAFSGGPDSFALLILAARWVRDFPHTHLIAFTVDHGLRTGSATEAETAGRLAAAIGVPHRILRWEGSKPESGVQAAARAARYRLLAAACREHGARDLLVAHHLEDQAETFLLRLRRGSGVDGLAAMPPARALDSGTPPVRLLRPLLDLPRGRLAATVAESGLEPILDPSNANDRFDRVRIRQAMEILATLGFDAVGLADTANRMARARAALEVQVASLMATHVTLSSLGYAEVNVAGLAAAPAELRLRVLATILKAVGGHAYGPRMEGLVAIESALLDGTLGRGRTLNGVKLSAMRGRLLAVRELAAARKALPLRLTCGESGIWDERFGVELEMAGPHPQLEVRAVGPEGLAALLAAGQALPLAPKAALMALPGLWAETRLVSAPHLGALDSGVRAHASVAQSAFLAQI